MPVSKILQNKCSVYTRIVIRYNLEAGSKTLCVIRSQYLHFTRVLGHLLAVRRGFQVGRQKPLRNHGGKA